MGHIRNTKIVCTLGPASEDRETIAALAEAGMSVARLNASHGTTEERRGVIERVRAVDRASPAPVAVLLDLAGPEVRTVEEARTLEADATVVFRVGAPEAPDEVGLSHGVGAATPGDRVLLDDGRIETVVEASGDGRVRARVETGGEVEPGAGVNVPGVDLGLPAVTDDDRVELRLAAETGVDFVAASFVRSAGDVLAVEEELDALGADARVIAKVERADAVANVGGIIAAADGVMVARGDLGVECPLEEVPVIQKRIIRRCHRAGVPVITATEMLDSMIHERRPTRAEASDVANAVLDGTDAVMLSGETAVGDHPTAVVETMARIVREVETSEEYAEVRDQRVPPADETTGDALARSARYLARDVGATAIVVASESGYTARKAAKYRAEMPVVAVTPDERVRRRLALSWGLVPRTTGGLAAGSAAGADAVIRDAVQAAIGTDLVESGDTVVVLSGMMTDLEDADTTNLLKVHVAATVLASGRGAVAGRATGPLLEVTDGDLTGMPDGAVLAVPRDFDGEFTGDTARLAGIVDAHGGMTSYAAMVAREQGLPAVCDVELPPEVADGRTVTVDGERGVVYAGRVRRDRPAER